MKWLRHEINRRIIQDFDGEFVATCKDEQTAAAIIDTHNEDELIESLIADALEDSLAKPVELLASMNGKLQFNCGYHPIDTRLAKSNGWTNHL